jgi:hypothetical protein
VWNRYLMHKPAASHLYFIPAANHYLQADRAGAFASVLLHALGPAGSHEPGPLGPEPAAPCWPTPPANSCQPQPTCSAHHNPPPRTKKPAAAASVVSSSSSPNWKRIEYVRILLSASQRTIAHADNPVLRDLRHSASATG